MSSTQDSQSSLVDVDSNQVKSEASDTAQQAKERSSQASQQGKEKTQQTAQTAKEKAREAGDYAKEKSSNVADSASANYDKAKKNAEKGAKRTKAEVKNEYNDVYENRDNPVVIANGVVIAVGTVALAYGAYTKNKVGELDGQLIGLVAAGVGAFAVADYYVSQ